MTTKYAVLNPNAGEYVYVDSQDQALVKAKELAWQFYLTHTHNSPISIITTNEDGSEIWQTLDLK